MLQLGLRLVENAPFHLKRCEQNVESPASSEWETLGSLRDGTIWPFFSFLLFFFKRGVTECEIRKLSFELCNLGVRYSTSEPISLHKKFPYIKYVPCLAGWVAVWLR